MLHLPDVNVLLYAVNSSAPQFGGAQAALKQAYLQGSVALCWPALLSFDADFARFAGLQFLHLR